MDVSRAVERGPWATWNSCSVESRRGTGPTCIAACGWRRNHGWETESALKPVTASPAAVGDRAPGAWERPRLAPGPGRRPRAGCRQTRAPQPVSAVTHGIPPAPAGHHHQGQEAIQRRKADHHLAGMETVQGLDSGMESPSPAPHIHESETVSKGSPTPVPLPVKDLTVERHWLPESSSVQEGSISAGTGRWASGFGRFRWRFHLTRS